MIPQSVFIFNLVVSKVQVMEFFIFLKFYFFRLTLKEPNLSKNKMVNFIQIKNKYFQYFPNIFIAIVQRSHVAAGSAKEEKISTVSMAWVDKAYLLPAAPVPCRILPSKIKPKPSPPFRFHAEFLHRKPCPGRFLKRPAQNFVTSCPAPLRLLSTFQDFSVE